MIAIYSHHNYSATSCSTAAHRSSLMAADNQQREHDMADNLLSQYFLAEYTTVRDEIAAHQAVNERCLGLAVTATGAVGAFALGRDGNREALLILPFVLSGLAIVYIRHTLDVEHLGQYLRAEWWPVVRATIPNFPLLPTSQTALPSNSNMLPWEDWIQKLRAEHGRFTPYGSLGFLPPILIFSVPGAGSLVLASPWPHGVGWLSAWILGLASLTTSGVLSLWVALVGPGWKRSPKSEVRRWRAG